MQNTCIQGVGTYPNVVVQYPFRLEGQNVEVWATDQLIAAIRSSNQYEAKHIMLAPGTYTIKVLQGTAVMPVQPNAQSSVASLYIDAGVNTDIWVSRGMASLSPVMHVNAYATRTVIGAPVSDVNVGSVRSLRAILITTASSYFQGIGIYADGVLIATVYATLGTLTLVVDIEFSVPTVVEFKSIDSSGAPPPYIFINSGVYYI